MQIRIANKQDESAIREVFLRALSEAGQEADYAGRDADLKNIEWSYFGKDGIFLVAEADKKIVGFAGARKKSDTELELSRLYVAEDWRRRGMGRNFLALILDFAANLDYLSIEKGETSDGNQVDELLIASGFQESSDADKPLRINVSARG